MTQNKPPKSVANGVRLLWIAFGLGILRAVIGIPMLKEPTTILITTIVVVPFVLLGAFLIYMVYKGKNWARITFLILFVVGIILNIENMILWFFAVQILLALYLLEIVLTITALYFLLQDKSSKWYSL